MALNIKNAEVERLTDELAALTGESKTEVIRRALEERRQRLAFRGARQDRGARLLRFLEQEAWPQIPPEILGTTLSKEEEERILGYGEGGF